MSKCVTCEKPVQLEGATRCNGCWEVEYRLDDYLATKGGQEKVKRALADQRRKNGDYKFYMFSQNNSGGRFSYDAEAGIGEYVIVEAESADDANKRAEDIGIYFDGCAKGYDCSCCGDRWSSAWENGNSEPMIYGMTLEDYLTTPGRSYRKNNIWVHYIDGTKQHFGEGGEG